MKLRVIACGVFEPELTALADETTNEVHLHFLDAGLHATPELLREQAQEQIDAACGMGYDAIILGYGLCGRGTSGILARDTRVIIPRVHDCLTLFMGSRAEYKRQFSMHPGTFYTTPGWYQKKSMGDKNAEGASRTVEDIHNDPRFPEFAQKFGEANAEHIIYFFDSWKRNYTRAAFIDTGAPDRDTYEEYAQAMAARFGWEYARLAGDVSMLRDVLDGRWDEDRALVLEPGQRSTLTGCERIFARVDTGHGQASESTGTGSGSAPMSSLPVSPDGTRDQDGGVLGIGIDAGGTYTDCVLYHVGRDEVMSKAKALTTRHDLLIGINEAMDGLTIPDPDQVQLVALSTTLATNSIVEGKGGRPGAIIMDSAIGAGDIPWPLRRTVGGKMTIAGVETEPPDPVEILRAVDSLLAEGVDAFAVSGYASVKNPDHELQVKRLIESRCDLPVVCGHELSSRLNFVSRANTAILNARLMPVIRELLDAVSASLDRRGISATLMVVKGDGALVNRKTAQKRPIETVLSGPAASVSGARRLTGLEDAIVLDMGGTTTDTAVIEGGMVRISPEGARVGGWLTSVEAAEISTVGVGGDSHLDFTVERKLTVGPRRVIPLCYLAARYPQVKRALEGINPAAQLDRSRCAALDFFLLVRPESATHLGEREQAIVRALENGPLARNVLAMRTGVQSARLLRTERLEELGIIQRSALTPTDVLHVSGQFAAWDTEAACTALEVFAALYGASADKVAELVHQAVVERLAWQIIAREWSDWADLPVDAAPQAMRTVFHPHRGDVLRASLSYERKIVALGAPVEPYFPEVGRRLGGEVVIPEHAEVANAIGAIASEVIVRERAVIRPGDVVNYVVHLRSGRLEYDDLHEAIESAKSGTAQLARDRALSSGTASQAVRHAIDERRAFSAEGDQVLVEVLVETTVSGKPMLKAAT